MANEEKAKILRPHSLSLEERQRLTVTGVEEVISFDDETVTARTSKGILVIGGARLRVDSLDKTAGQMTVSGEVRSLCYEEDRAGQSFWSRILR